MQDTSGDRPSLVADVGGSNLRVALTGAVGIEHFVAWPCAEHGSLEEALRLYLEQEAPGLEPRCAAIAVACPVADDWLELTNQDWSFSRSQLRDNLGLERLEVINDFTAVALAVPHLGGDDSRLLKDGTADDSAPIAILGPGTGLGVSALVPTPEGWLPLDTEGGHRDLAASDGREWEVLQALQRTFGRVSCERVLSGPGLTNLYLALCHIEGIAPQADEPAEVVGRSLKPACRLEREAVELFSGWLGAFAGDLALTLGARGGVYLGGGVLPRMGWSFSDQTFTERFLDKGRFRSYLEPIPIRMVLKTEVALMGAAFYLDQTSV